VFLENIRLFRYYSLQITE